MQNITLKVDSVLWQEPEHGAIFTGHLIENDMPGEHKGRIRIPYSVSVDEHIRPGQWWRILGDTETFKGTPQIAATEALLLRPSGEHIVDLLAGDRLRFPGIGVNYAWKLWDKLGNRLYELLEARNDVDLCTVMRQLKIPKAEEASAALIEGWEDLGIGETVSWLDNLPSAGRLSAGLGRKICRCWGTAARKQVEEDPYRLISFMSTRHFQKGWKIVDDIAIKVFGLVSDDERRLHGALIDSIYSHYDNKNTIIDRETLQRKISIRLGSKILAKEALTRSHGKNSFLHNGEFWQARGTFLMEKEIAEQLAKILRFKQPGLLGEKRFEAAEIDKAITEFEEQEGYPLGNEQRAAVHLCLDNNLSVITGGAGTGKTSVLKCLYHILNKAGDKNCQMALAGRAARRMTEATGYTARTIAGFLASTNKNYTAEGMTFVIDESSMLDLPTTFQLLRRLPEDCRLILVGDAEKLPPIGPGLVFHVLAKLMIGIVPTTVLTKVYRQEGVYGIPAVAEAIRGTEQKDPTLSELPKYSGPGKGVSIYPAKPVEMEKVLTKIYAELGGDKPGEDVKILAITRDMGPYGMRGINRFLQNEYALGKKRVLGFNADLKVWSNSGEFAEGDPVMFSHNDWDRDLFNGTLGVVEKAYAPPSDEYVDPSVTPSAKVSFDTGTQDITVEDLGSLELAYAITVHKSQGSQFKRVIIPVRKGPLLDKALVYTAITRGIEQVVLVGDIDAAREAIENGAATDKRQVGLGQMLKSIIRE